MTTRRLLNAAAVVLAVAAFDADTTSAQTVIPADRWAAWAGCWRAEGAPANETLCVMRDGAGARMLTVVDGQIRAEWPVLTDGRARNVQREDCNGSELSHWSVDGQRVFLNSDLVCSGVKREVSGIFAMNQPGQWLSVQAITIGDNTATRIVRYNAIDQRTMPGAIQSLIRGLTEDRLAAREAALVPIDADDVTEAANSVADAAVREWLSAIDAPFQLDVDEPTPDTNVPYDAISSQWSPYSYNTPGVVVIDPHPQPTRTVYVTNNIYRTCWDPFYSGLVVGYRYGIGSYSYSNCGPGYYSRYYSPWGYDLFGWRLFSRPIYLLRGPTIIRRTININRPPTRVIRRDNNWDNNRDNNWDNNDRQRGRVTRNGYSSGSNTSDRNWQTQRTGTGSQSDRSRTSTGSNNGSWTNRSRGGDNSGTTVRTQRGSTGSSSSDSQRTRSTSSGTGNQRSRASSGSNSSGSNSGSRATSGGYQSTSGSRGTAKARTGSH